MAAGLAALLMAAGAAGAPGGGPGPVEEGGLPHPDFIDDVPPGYSGRFPPPLFPGDGQLDLGFGWRGMVLMSSLDPLEGAAAYALAIQPDGKILAAGYSDSSFPSLVARFNADGGVDGGFGAAGRARAFGGAVRAITLQPDGRIVIGGHVSDLSPKFALARLEADGSLDPAFGTAGIVVTDFPGTSESVLALVVQPDGRIVAAGRAAAPSDFALARYNPDGSLDTGFGLLGLVTTDFAGGSDAAAAVALQEDGRIVAAGSAGGGTGDFALARYTPGGGLDPTFGSGGRVMTDFAGSADGARGLGIQPGGRIVAGGWAGSATHDFALAGYTPDGHLDPGFGTGGRTVTDFSGGIDEVNALVLQPDGRIVTAGFSGHEEYGWPIFDFALARHRPDGTPDPTFGRGGTLTTDVLGGDDVAFALAIQPDGRLVAAGIASSFVPRQNSPSIALARYSRCNGANPKCSVRP